MIRLAVFPTGAYAESYYFELMQDSVLSCAVGVRASDDITRTDFLVTIDHSAEMRLSSENIQFLSGLCDDLESSGYNTPKNIYFDAWDVAVLYNGKTYETNYWDNNGPLALIDLVDKLIELAPIPVDLHGWA